LKNQRLRNNICPFFFPLIFIFQLYFQPPKQNIGLLNPSNRA
jgi:hypothetical protein